jgi:hypothetical protein
MFNKPKIALITTTINVPLVLKLYRALDGAGEFFIAGDKKSPHDEIRAFLKREVPNANYYSPEDQTARGYACSEIIGWNKIMRRNFALLEAIRSGAEYIVTIDDDNIPLDANYFQDMLKVLSKPYTGISVNSAKGWFNIGQYMTPHVYHRGFPYPLRHQNLGVKMGCVKDARVGLAAGLWLGDPDIDAMTRIVNQPDVHYMSDLAASGVVVENDCWTVFNSQNTAFLREVAPLMMVWCGVGRYDDIWASYLTQRIMRERGYHVHFGKPFVWQERNVQNLNKNLKDEILGIEFTPQLVSDLDAMDIGKGSVLDQMQTVYNTIRGKDYLPPVVGELGDAWIADLRKFGGL